MGDRVRQSLRHAARAGRSGIVGGTGRVVRHRLARNPAAASKGERDVVRVFILPPSAAELERRLHTRAQDSDEVIRERMSRATHELSHWAEYDYIVVNHSVDEAFAEVQSILKAERLKRERRTGLTEFVRNLQRQLEK